MSSNVSNQNNCLWAQNASVADPVCVALIKFNRKTDAKLNAVAPEQSKVVPYIKWCARKVISMGGGFFVLPIARIVDTVGNFALTGIKFVLGVIVAPINFVAKKCSSSKEQLIDNTHWGIKESGRHLINSLLCGIDIIPSAVHAIFDLEGSYLLTSKSKEALQAPSNPVVEASREPAAFTLEQPQNSQEELIAREAAIQAKEQALNERELLLNEQSLRLQKTINTLQELQSNNNPSPPLNNAPEKSFSERLEELKKQKY